MDYEKLIERLKHDYHGYSTVENNPEETFHDMVEYLTALSTLQAENKKLRAELNDLRAQWDMYGGDEGITSTFAELEQAGAEIARLKHYEDKCHDCPIVCAKTEIIKAHEELEAVQAELERVKQERDAAVEDLHKLCPAFLTREEAALRREQDG